MFGLSVMAVGVWAWTEKNAFNNLSKLTHLALDPAFALILIGKKKKKIRHINSIKLYEICFEIF